MISEQITVTTTPTSISALIEAARSLAAGGFKPTKCIGIMLRYLVAETELVTVSDADSVAGAVVLDGAGEALTQASFKAFSTDKVLLSVNTGTVLVHLVVEQDRI